MLEILYISYFCLNRILNIQDLYLFKILNMLEILYILYFYLNRKLIIQYWYLFKNFIYLIYLFK